jgi:EmrB/QacA subfamily drug resistance transporter
MTAESSNVAAGVVSRLLGNAPIFVISIAIFITTFDITAVIMVMPNIKSELSLDIGGFAWVMDAYSLTFTVFLMTAGVLADRYGRRSVLLFGNALFLVSSVFCGIADSQTALLVARATQGVGSAFIVCGGLALIGHRYVERTERAKAFALLGSISGAAMALGPALGGLVANWLGWHWVFFINVPICVVVAIMILRVVSESSDPTPRRLDILGLFTLSLFLVSFVWTLLHGPRVGSFEVSKSMALAIIVAEFAAFVVAERIAKQPIVELSLFRNPIFMGTCLVPLALSVGYWAILIYLPLFLQERLGQSLERTSVLMLAVTLPMAILPLVGARMSLALKPGPFFASGLAVVAGGCLMVAVSAENASLALSLLGMAIAGAGAAVVHSQVSGAIVALVPREQAGAASAITIMLRQGGFALGIALLAVTLTAERPSLVSGVQPYAFLFIVAGLAAIVGAVGAMVLIRQPQKDVA